MKIGIFTKPNSKGQVVIAKELRDALKITPDTVLNMVLMDGGVYIAPVKEVVTESEAESSYLRLLEKTQGGWGGDDWEETEAKQDQFEKQSAQSEKNKW